MLSEGLRGATKQVEMSKKVRNLKMGKNRCDKGTSSVCNEIKRRVKWELGLNKGKDCCTKRATSMCNERGELRLTA